MQDKAVNEFPDLMKYLRYVNREKWAILACFAFGILLAIMSFAFTTSGKRKIFVMAKYDLASSSEPSRLAEMLSKNPIDPAWLATLSAEERSQFFIPFGRCLSEPGSRECLIDKIGMRGARVVDGKLILDWQFYAVSDDGVHRALSYYGGRLLTLTLEHNSYFNERANITQEANRNLFESQMRYSSIVNEIYDELSKSGSAPVNANSAVFGQNPMNGIDGSFLLLARLEKSRNAEEKALRERLLAALVEQEVARTQMLQANQALQKSYDPIHITNLTPEVSISEADSNVLRPLSIFIVFGVFTGIGLSIIYLAVKIIVSILRNPHKVSQT